jgi:hypothetical protein
MRNRIAVVLASAVFIAIVGLLTAPAVSAQVWDHKTTITVDQPFEVPGRILPAGTYVLRIVDIADNRTVLRIFSEDEQTVMATIMGIPDFRLKPTPNSDVTFYESQTGTPKPLHAWFYKGYQYGLEFVYPERRAEEIAYVSEEHVIAVKEPTMPDIIREKPEPTVKELLTEPLIVIEPEMPELEEVPEIAAVHPEEFMTAPAQLPEVPKTATPFPGLAVVGLLAAAAATAMRILRS